MGPLLREANVEDGSIDLDDVALSHYRLSKLKQQNLSLAIDGGAAICPKAGPRTGNLAHGWEGNA